MSRHPPLSSALSPSNNRGQAVQVDVSKLSQLVIGQNAHAFKQLALCNVDAHVIGCMLMLGEYVPASSDYRRILGKARQEQRNEKLWMYKLVEIGAASNYLSDQFLKTRLGENVIALLAVSVSTMGEDACIALLSKLFECIGATEDRIPGRYQLENIRRNLAPLARRTGFGEKVAHYHSHFLHLLPVEGRNPVLDYYSSIPDAPQAALIIKQLHRVMTSDENFVLIWNGIRGAAWVVAYSAYVLGINVCALDAEMNPVPISSTYEEAKVVVQIGTQQSVCELYLERELQDVFHIDTSKSFENRGWSIDCRAVNFVELNHPGLSDLPEFTRLSTFAAVEIYNTLYEATSFFEQWTPDALWYRENSTEYDNELQRKKPLGFKTYIKSVLRGLHGRALLILREFGLRPAMEGFIFDRDGQSCSGHVTDPAPTYDIIQVGGEEHEIEQKLFGATIGTITRQGESHGVKVLNNKGSFLQRDAGLDFLSRVRNYLDVNKTTSSRQSKGSNTTYSNAYGDISLDGNARAHLGDVHVHYGAKDKDFLVWSKEKQKTITDTLKLLIDIASRLAFTDWHQSIRMLSINVMSPDYHVESPDERQFEGLVAEAISFCFDGVETRALEKRIWTDDWTALDLDGVIVYRTVARTPDIAGVRGKLVSFASGSIQFEGTGYIKVRNDRSAAATPFSYQDKSISKYLPHTTLTLRNKFPNLRMRPLVTAKSDTLFLRAEMYLDGDKPIFVDGTMSAKMLPELLVSDPCQHGYRSDLELDAFFKNRQYIGQLFEGLYFDDARGGGVVIGNKLTGCPVYIQHTKDNSVLQWLALQWKPRSESERCLRVLQKDCCLPCILDRLRVIVESIHRSSAPVLADGYPICIIAGDDPSRHLSVGRTRPRAQQAHRFPQTDEPSKPLRSAASDPSIRGSRGRASSDASLSSSNLSVDSNAGDMPIRHQRSASSSVKRKPVPTSSPLFLP